MINLEETKRGDTLRLVEDVPGFAAVLALVRVRAVRPDHIVVDRDGDLRRFFIHELDMLEKPEGRQYLSAGYVEEPPPDSEDVIDLDEGDA